MTAAERIFKDDWWAEETWCTLCKCPRWACPELDLPRWIIDRQEYFFYFGLLR